MNSRQREARQAASRASMDRQKKVCEALDRMFPLPPPPFIPDDDSYDSGRPVTAFMPDAG